MHPKFIRLTFLLIAAFAVAQAAQAQTVAIRAGRLFDPKSGTNLQNQVILVTGDRITDVGPAATIKVPAGAKVIDLSFADGAARPHRRPRPHLTDGKGDQMAEARKATHDSLNAGFTTVVAQGSHRWCLYRRRSAEADRQRQGGRSAPHHRRTDQLGTELAAKGADQFRKGLDELHAHGAMHAKIVPNSSYSWDKQGKMSNTAVVSFDELKAAVDEGAQERDVRRHAFASAAPV